LKFIGNGEYRAYFEKLAKEVNIEKNVKFYGRVSGGEAISNLN
jgi:glycosyltransferase involved in cell wall biosynthesis